MNCPNCGMPLGDDDWFCPSCATSFTPEQVSAQQKAEAERVPSSRTGRILRAHEIYAPAPRQPRWPLFVSGAAVVVALFAAGVAGGLIPAGGSTATNSSSLETSSQQVEISLSQSSDTVRSSLSDPTVSRLSGKTPGAIKLDDSAGQATRYLVYAQSLTWLDAQEYCESRGGHLAYPKSRADWDAMLAACEQAGAARVFWVGAKRDVNGTFRWIDGTEVDEYIWATGEPNNEQAQEDYAAILVNSQGKGLYDVQNDLASYYADEYMGFILELD